MKNWYVKYNKKQELCVSRVRELCIKYNFYTCGDNNAYSDMFAKCINYTGKVEELQCIAGDIFSHSDHEELEDYGFDTIYEIIAWIMTLLERECMLVTYEAEEGEE